jgi:cation transport regulator ChaB
MSLPESTREKWDLPKHVQELYEEAFHAEVEWHIFDVFGY